MATLPTILKGMFWNARRSNQPFGRNFGKGALVKAYPDGRLEVFRPGSKPSASELATFARDAGYSDYSVLWEGDHAFIVPDEMPRAA
jgi:hypothetical protein